MSEILLANRLSNGTRINNHPQQRKLREKNWYWFCQVSGWAVFTLINLAVISSFGKYNWQRLVVYLTISLTGLFLTHQYRSLIKKNNWTSLQIKKVIPRILLTSIIIGLIIYAIAFGIDYALGQFKSDEFRIVSVLLGIFNLSGIIAVWSLIYFSFHYFQKYKRVEIESYIWEAAVKDFELKTLKSQLNPHFIFNALNSIRALVQEDPQSAQSAITKLSNILRYSLRMERSETVSLEDEMQTVMDYLSLEKMRLEERIKYNVSIDPKTLKIDIPPMMIQTLVENGIKHGISKRTEGGIISVRTCLDNNNLVIRIVNSGHFNDEMLKKSEGFGISNTKQRLNLIYGDAAKFEIKNNSDDTVSAEIIIPIGG